MSSIVALAVIGVLLLCARRGEACTTLLVGKKASANGRVIVGHNEDDPGRLVVRHGLVPARTYSDGARMICEEYAARPALTGTTPKIFWTEVRDEKGMSSADCFVNEWGVVLVSNSCAHSRKDDEPATILERLKVYHELTEPLVDFYRERGKLVVVEGQEEVADTTRLLLEKLGVSL